MSKKQITIRTVQDIARLSEDQQGRFLVDLAAWLVLTRQMQEIASLLPSELASVTVPDDCIQWVDDDRPGEVSGMTMHVSVDRGASE